eukprot:COSAG01_NODE_216_length_21695_cov_83.368772_17_plen_280_part_00
MINSFYLTRFLAYLVLCCRPVFRFFVNTCFPSFLQARIQDLFMRSVGLQADQLPSAKHLYPSLQALFTREGLCKKVSEKEAIQSVLSPVDALVQTLGQVKAGQVIQAKGLHYGIKQLLPFDSVGDFEGASFCTLYLAPTDCHRIYAPASANLLSLHHVSGYLRPVRQPWIDVQPGLYAQNERTIALFENDCFLFAMAMVAALNVGDIELALGQEQFAAAGFAEAQSRFFDQAIAMKQGDHVATFLLGSTVILFAQPKRAAVNFKVKIGDKLKIGQSILA